MFLYFFGERLTSLSFIGVRRVITLTPDNSFKYLVTVCIVFEDVFLRSIAAMWRIKRGRQTEKKLNKIFLSKIKTEI